MLVSLLNKNMLTNKKKLLLSTYYVGFFVKQKYVDQQDEAITLNILGFLFVLTKKQKQIFLT